MKKIRNLLIIFMFLVCPLNIHAQNYFDKVSVKTIFEDKVKLEEINEIEIHLEDATEYSKDYILEKSNNFELTIEDVPVGPYKFLYGVVIDDKIGYYSISATVNKDEINNSIEVLVTVETTNMKTDSNGFTEEDINRIEGSTGTNNNKNENKLNDSNSGEIIIGDEEESNSLENEEPTTVPKEIEEARKKEEEEIKKKEKRKQNSLIGKIMFSIIGIVLAGLIIYAAIKISNANK